MKKQIQKSIPTKLEMIRHSQPRLQFGGGNAAGIHTDQPGRYGKRQRAENRLQERLARLERGE